MAALIPEKKVSKRFWVDVRVEGRRVIVFGEASDLSSLRAALNSYARWLTLAKRIEKVVGDIQRR